MDDLLLVNEVLESLPEILGVNSVMTPMLRPYYNGVPSEDCGISAFIFLPGGHITLHTFSYRETIFAGVLSESDFSCEKFIDIIMKAFPCRLNEHEIFRRDTTVLPVHESNEDTDFGPHLCMNFYDIIKKWSFEDVFHFLDQLPKHINMTPIMRPYVVKNMSESGNVVLSGMTMIAESHIALHMYPELKKAYFDLFSCSFFDVSLVTKCVNEYFGIEAAETGYLSRGKNYKLCRTEAEHLHAKSSRWLSFLKENDVTTSFG